MGHTASPQDELGPVQRAVEIRNHRQSLQSNVVHDFLEPMDDHMDEVAMREAAIPEKRRRANNITLVGENGGGNGSSDGAT